MKRIVQSRTGEDGTCFRACVASIMGVSERSIPDFGAFGNDETWWNDIQTWLAKAGLEYVRIPIDGARPTGYSTIEGVSPRGGLHACVAFDGELVWDPHPIEDGTGQGLVEPRYYGVFRKVGRARDAAPEIVYGPFPRKSDADAALTKLRRTKSLYKTYDMTYVRERFTNPTAKQTAAGYELGDYRLSQGFFVFGSRKHAIDRADMLQLRKNTERQGGPFFIQETTKSGKERTIPVRNLSKT